MLLDYLIMLVYALAMLGLGWYGMRKAKSQSDFLVAGRRLGPGLYLGTMAAVVLGGASTIGTVKLGYQFGLSGLWLVFMLGLGIIVLSLVFSRQIARLRVFTVTQVLEQRYQASSRLIGGVVMVAYDLMVAVTATIAIGSVTEVVFGIPRIPAILCGGGIVIVYSVIGGMWSLTLTDIIQFVIKTVGIFLVLLPLSIDGAGGLARMQEVLPAGFFDLGHIGLDTILTYFLLYFFGALIGQDIWQRVFTARSETVVRYAGLGAGVYCMLYGAACALIGAAARVLLPDLAVADYLDDFSFSPDYRYLLGSSRQARGGEVIELDSGARVASIPLSGMPHLGSGIYWKRDGRWVFATPNISRGVISVIDLQNWKPLKEIVTDGPGFFMRSHADSPYAWTDTFLGKKHDEILLIDKQTLEIAHRLRPSPGKVAGHVEFTRDGRYALLSVWDRDGALVVYDAHSLEEVKRLPMNKPSGKYNVGNKIGYAEGTSH
ncbi:hypothetical protein NAG22_08560 [Pseudomonas aeruginosa]|nr:hypothetical protein [Pseudomonas aeruginosa]